VDANHERGPSPRGTTLHLTPEDVWVAHRGRADYQPEGFAAEGFVHCTDDEAVLLEIANLFYQGDPRPFLLLDVDLEEISAPAIYEDEERRFPHVYGPITLNAVRRVRRVERTADGMFVAIGAAAPEHLP
jgi:uncharacterized protein (DUF952 family)